MACFGTQNVSLMRVDFRSCEMEGSWLPETEGQGRWGQIEESQEALPAWRGTAPRTQGVAPWVSALLLVLRA